MNRRPARQAKDVGKRRQRMSLEARELGKSFAGFRAVNNVNVTEIHNIYNTTVVNNAAVMSFEIWSMMSLIPSSLAVVFKMNRPSYRFTLYLC